MGNTCTALTICQSAWVKWHGQTHDTMNKISLSSFKLCHLFFQKQNNNNTLNIWFQLNTIGFARENGSLLSKPDHRFLMPFKPIKRRNLAYKSREIKITVSRASWENLVAIQKTKWEDRLFCQNNENSDMSKIFVENWTKGHVSNILSSKWSAVWPCFQTLREAKFKFDGLIRLKEETLSHHSTKFVPWSFLPSLIQIDSDNWE